MNLTTWLDNVWNIFVSNSNGTVNQKTIKQIGTEQITIPIIVPCWKKCITRVVHLMQLRKHQFTLNFNKEFI